MQFIAVDLGTTNTKAGVFNEEMLCLKMLSRPVHYSREGHFVEFDAESYVQDLLGLIRELAASPEVDARKVANITLTGQAESLVVLDSQMKPLMPAISWMDDRSAEACAELEKQFSKETYYARTGQLAILPTWPATKILWLKKHLPTVHEKARYYVLLKDYIAYVLSGKLAGDRSIATFSFYFDIYSKQYWPQMLEACHIREAQLPELIEPCSDLGPLRPELLGSLGLDSGVHVNTGTLDHFAGMVGTGNVLPGTITLSMGTVMGLSTMAQMPVNMQKGIALHYGFLPDSYVMLPVAESGGICLEWFKRTCMPGDSYEEINRVLQDRSVDEPIFLPYILGANAPEFDLNAAGMFYGLHDRHDRYDMAHAIMEGVAHLLRKNCDHIMSSGALIQRIVSTGGGTKSALWCQLQADITGLPIHIPQQEEAACMGAAMIGAVSAGRYENYEAAAKAVVRIERSYQPRTSALLERKHRQFNALYQAMKSVQAVE
jgi:xylulokinase